MSEGYKHILRITGTASTPTETEIDIIKWNTGEYHTKQQLMDCVNAQAGKIKLLESELAKERGVVDYYGSDIWDLCEDIVSGNQRSCIQYGDDDGSDIFGGVRARQRIKERAILKGDKDE